MCVGMCCDVEGGGCTAKSRNIKLHFFSFLGILSHTKPAFYNRWKLSIFQTVSKENHSGFTVNRYFSEGDDESWSFDTGIRGRFKWSGNSHERSLDLNHHVPYLSADVCECGKCWGKCW